MAQARNISVLKMLLGVSDKATPELKKVQKNFAAFKKNVEKTSKNLSRLAKLTLAPFAAGLAAAGAALKSSVSSMVEYGSSVDDTSRSLGIAADSLQAFRYAADLGGSSAEEMDGAIAMLNKNIANAAAGKGKDLVKLMDAMGISMKKSDGSMKTAAELMPEIADAIARQKDSTQKAYIATQFFGRSGQNLIKTLSDGSKGLEEARKEAEKFGVIMSAEDVEAAAKFGDSMGRTRKAVQGVQNAIGRRLLPVLQPMLDYFNDLIADNREWLATEITDAVKDLAKELMPTKEGLRDAVKATISFVKASVKLFRKLGGLKTIAIAVGAIFGMKLVGSFAATVVSLVKLGGSFITLAKSVGVAMKLINVAFMSNPITLVLALIAMAIAAIYENWDTIGPWLKDSWESVCKFFTEQWELVKNNWSYIWDLIKAKWEEAKANFDAICKAFNDAWDAVCKWFSDQWDQAKANFDANCKAVSDIWDGICKGVQDAWDAVWKWVSDKVDENVKTSQEQLETLRHVFCDVIPDAIMKAWEWLKTKLLDIFDVIMKPINAITDTVGGLMDSVGGTVKGAWNGVKDYFGFGDSKGSAPSLAAAPAYAGNYSAFAGAAAGNADVASLGKLPPQRVDTFSNMKIEFTGPAGYDARVTQQQSSGNQKLSTVFNRKGALR